MRPYLMIVYRSFLNKRLDELLRTDVTELLLQVRHEKVASESFVLIGRKGVK